MKSIAIDEKIFKKHRVKLAYLFGSRAKGNAAAQSDFDVAVVFEKEPSDPLALQETSALQEALGTFFPATLDIVSLHSASTLLRYEVISTGKNIYSSSESDRANFEVSVIKEYIDQRPLRMRYSQAMHNRILSRG